MLNLDKHFVLSVLQQLKADKRTANTGSHVAAVAATEEAVPEAAGKHAASAGALAATAGDPCSQRAAEGCNGQHAGANRQPSENSERRHTHCKQQAEGSAQQAGSSGQQAAINGQQMQDSGHQADSSRSQGRKKGEQTGRSRQRHSCSGQQLRNGGQQTEAGGQQAGSGQQCKTEGQRAGPSSMAASMPTSADVAAVPMAATRQKSASPAVAAKCLDSYRVAEMAAREAELESANASAVPTAAPTSGNNAPNGKSITAIPPPQALVDTAVDGNVDNTVGKVVEESAQLADDEATFRAVTGTECIAYGAVRYKTAITEVLAQEAGHAQVVERSVKLAVSIAATRALVVAGVKVVYQDTEAVLEKAQVHFLVCVILAKEA